MTSKAIIFIFLMALIVGSASALPIDLLDVTAYSYTVPSSEYTIYQVSANNLDVGVSIFNFSAYGQDYQIQVNCTKNYGWWDFAVDVTYPNSTVLSLNASTLQPFATDYDAKIQYTDSELDWILDVDLYVDFNPVSANIVAPTTLYQNKEPVFFNSVNGTLSDSGDVTIYIGSQDDITDILEDNLWAQFVRSASNIFGDLFLWSWEMIVAFVSSIPYVGEYFVEIMKVFGGILGEIWFYFSLFVLEEPEVSLVIVEVFILSHAIISGNTLMRMLRILYKDHVALITGIVHTAQFVLEIIRTLIEIVSNIINAVKPI